MGVCCKSAVFPSESVALCVCLVGVVIFTDLVYFMIHVYFSFQYVSYFLMSVSFSCV